MYSNRELAAFHGEKRTLKSEAPRFSFRRQIRAWKKQPKLNSAGRLASHILALQVQRQPPAMTLLCG